MRLLTLFGSFFQQIELRKSYWYNNQPKMTTWKVDFEYGETECEKSDEVGAEKCPLLKTVNI